MDTITTIPVTKPHKNILEKVFKLKEHKTNASTEIGAGLTTFMTMAYVLIVHPMMMKSAGMPVDVVTAATALGAGLFCIIMGLYTNLPFAIAPAMGNNAFFAYTLVAGGIVTWQQGMVLVLISGILFLLLTLLGLRDMIVKIVPKTIKVSIGAAVGLFLAQLGFKNAGILDFKNGMLALGDIHQPVALVAFIGFIISVVLMARKVKGALLWGIISTTIISIFMGITKLPEQLISMPPSIYPVLGQLDFNGAFKLALFPAMFTLFTGDFFCTFGTLIGVSSKAGYLDENGNLPGIEKPFLVDALGTIVGSLMGLTTLTTYVESAAGVEEGGRTGLTAVTTGIIFLLMLFLTPLALIIPGAATAPALIIIGMMMVSEVKEIDFNEFTEALPAFSMLIVTAYTSNMSTGITVGVIMYVFVKVAAGKAKELHTGLYALCIPLVYYLATL